MKYYLANIDEQSGEFSFSTTICFATDGDATEYHENVARTWYDEDGAELYEHGVYWNDYVAHSAGQLTEVDKGTFEGVQKHIMKLTG
tara:strand:+ start:335 stop:595 length:261 start_codon:yes stop_codon:yes gene_type:complete